MNEESIAQLGIIGLGLVWGWLLGSLRPPLRAPLRTPLALVAGTAALGLEVRILTGGGLELFVASSLLAALLHLGFRRALARRYGSARM